MTITLPDLPLELILLIISFVPDESFEIHHLTSSELPFPAALSRYFLSLQCRKLYYLLGATMLDHKHTVLLRTHQLHNINDNDNIFHRVCHSCTYILPFWHFFTTEEGNKTHIHCRRCKLSPTHSARDPNPFWCGANMKWCHLCRDYEINLNNLYQQRPVISAFYNCESRWDRMRSSLLAFGEMHLQAFSMHEFIALMDEYWELVWPETGKWFLVKQNQWPSKLRSMQVDQSWYGRLYELAMWLRRIDENAAGAMRKMWVGKDAVRRRLAAWKSRDVDEARRTRRLKMEMDKLDRRKHERGSKSKILLKVGKDKREWPWSLWGAHQTPDVFVIERLVELCDFEDTLRIGCHG